MYNYVCIGLFILLYVYIVDVEGVSCPTSKNQPVNITRISDRIGVTWVKNNNNPITNAVYNSTIGGCLLPSNTAGYTIYCGEYDNNNKYKFTLQVHQPVEGDVYYTNDDQNTTTTIIFQDPVKIEPQLTDTIILTNETKIQLNTTVTCTQLAPVFTWIIKSRDGDETTVNGSTTSDTTGCDANKTTLSSRVRISKDTVKIINDPFTVSVQLSYKECDNIYTSQPTPYFTTKGSDSGNLPVSTYIGIGIGGAVLFLIIIIIIIVSCWCKNRKKDKATDSRENITGTSNSRNGVDSPLRRDEIIVDENMEYVGGIFSDSVQYAVVNKKQQDERKGNEIIVDENVEYVGLGDVSPPVVPTRGYKESKKTKKGEELKYAEVDFSNQKPSTKIRGGGTKQSTVNYADINHFNNN